MAASAVAFAREYLRLARAIADRRTHFQSHIALEPETRCKIDHGLLGLTDGFQDSITRDEVAQRRTTARQSCARLTRTRAAARAVGMREACEAARNAPLDTPQRQCARRRSAVAASAGAWADSRAHPSAMHVPR